MNRPPYMYPSPHSAPAAAHGGHGTAGMLQYSSEGFRHGLATAPYGAPPLPMPSYYGFPMNGAAPPPSAVPAPTTTVTNGHGPLSTTQHSHESETDETSTTADGNRKRAAHPTNEELQRLAQGSGPEARKAERQIRNRISAKRSRQKRLKEIADLQDYARKLEDKVKEQQHLLQCKTRRINSLVEFIRTSSYNVNRAQQPDLRYESDAITSGEQSLSNDATSRNGSVNVETSVNDQHGYHMEQSVSPRPTPTFHSLATADTVPVAEIPSSRTTYHVSGSS